MEEGKEEGKKEFFPRLESIKKESFFLRRSPVTLVELLIVMTIILLIGGVIGINITKAVKEQRFRTEVSQMVQTLRLAQNLMLILGKDVNVLVQENEKEKKIVYFIEVEEEIPNNWKRIIEKTRKTLIETHGVFFKEQQLFSTVEGQIKIRFQSGGSLMSKGALQMSTHEVKNSPGAEVYTICLKGYPHAIEGFFEGEKSEKCEDKSSDAFDNALTTYMIQEIKEDRAFEREEDGSS